MPHRLEPLLRPTLNRCGGRDRAHRNRRSHEVANLLKGGFDGALFAVNPRYQSVCGVPCFPSLAALPEPVEHVIFAVSDERIEAALDEVIAHGARAATIMSSLVLAQDRKPNLQERVLAKIRASGLVVCGANGMGFYNFAAGIWACGFETRVHARGGNVAYISHSGSGMCGIVDSEERIDFNLVVSTGQELAVTMDEYLDFALDQPTTRAVGLFMETARNPQGLARAFEKAQRARHTHRRAEGGSYGARPPGWPSRIRAPSPARTPCIRRCSIATACSAWTTWMSSPRPSSCSRSRIAVGAGGLVSIHDSGGERQLLIDLAHEARVPLTQISLRHHGAARCTP